MKRAFCSGFLLLLLSAAEAQVNPQNGAATVSIPLYSYADAGSRLAFNVSLDYVDGNGLPVSEMASSVGTGWALNCGGVIQRIQHGEPDDQWNPNPQAFTLPSGALNSDYANHYYPNGFLYNTAYLATDAITNQGAYTIYNEAFNPLQNGYKEPPEILADRDQDIFQFSFNGRSGSFVIGKNSQVVTLNDSKLQISFQTANTSPIRTTINQFTITDETGIQYVFKDMELSYVVTYTDYRHTATDNTDIPSLTSNAYSLLQYSSPSANNGSAINILMAIPNGSFVADKWYLSEIINPFTGKQITLNYDTYEEDKNTDKVISASTLPSGFLGNATIVWQKYKVRGRRLSSVVLSDNERIDLSYPTPRIDLPNQNALSQLIASYKGSQIYSWNFGYGYMVGIESAIKSPTDAYTDSEKQWARLCLQTLTKTGQNNTSEPPYQFAYNMGGDNAVQADVIPPMFSIYQDHFGYYNAGQYVTSTTWDTYSSVYSISNLITWLRNGLTTYRLPLRAVAKNGILKSITYPMGGSLTYSYEANSTEHGLFGGVRVNSTLKYDGISHTNDVIKQYNYINADGSPSGWGGESFAYSFTTYYNALSCAPKQTPMGLVKDIATSYVERNMGGSNLFQPNATSMGIAVGLEVVREFSPALAAAITVAYEIYTLFAGQQNPPATNGSCTTYQNTSLNSNNRLPWGYARTEEISVLGSGTIGKTVYEYTSTADHGFENPSMSVNYSNKPRYAHWIYGLPKSITIYDQSMTNIVKKTISHYATPTVTPLATPDFASTSWTSIGSEMGCNPREPNGAHDLIQQEASPYYPLTGHMVLTSTDEIAYNSAQQSMTVTTTFDYDNNLQVSDQATTNSKGQTIKTFYYYPYNYPNATGAIGSMNTNKILGPALSVETYLSPTTGSSYMIAATAANYGQVTNGDFKPVATYNFQSVQPVASGQLLASDQAHVVRDPNYYKQLSAVAYDNNGNAVQSITGGNRIASTIYDYDGKLPVAFARNASYNDIGYTSFEAEGGKSGATLNTAAIVSTDARTGSKCFNLSDPSNATNGYFGFSLLNSSLNYIVSFWSKNGSACVQGAKSGATIFNSCQGAAGWKQGATVNGWTYYEVQVNTIDQISVTGSGLIDEFRIYPVGAQMATTTYAPLIGKTSECDASGKVTYFQYDNLNRLRYVKDDKGNIIRMYDYNYKQ